MTGCCSAAPASIPVAGGGSSGQGDTEQRTINGQGWSQWLRISMINQKDMYYIFLKHLWKVNIKILFFTGLLDENIMI